MPETEEQKNKAYSTSVDILIIIHLKYLLHFNARYFYSAGNLLHRHFCIIIALQDFFFRNTMPAAN